jgi:hypothetical protein
VIILLTPGAHNKEKKSSKMAEGEKEASVRRTKTKGHRKTAKSVTCPICEDVIKDKSGQEIGEDSILCEGKCSTWLHRRCAGLSKVVFTCLITKKEAFLCPHCRLDSTINEMKEIKESVASLQDQISELKQQLAREKNHRDTTHQPNSYATIASSKQPPPLLRSNDERSIPVDTSESPQVIDKKFNLVIYGIPENEKGTTRNNRLENDLSKCSSVVRKINPEISTDPIRDTIRLGKYSESRHRPILLRFARAIDVSKILSSRKNLATVPGVSIKPQLSPWERKVESVLLKERRCLIDSGVSPSKIKISIRLQSLFIESKLHGKALSGSFTRTTDPDYMGSDSSDSEPEDSPTTNKSDSETSSPSVTVVTVPTTSSSNTQPTPTPITHH